MWRTGEEHGIPVVLMQLSFRVDGGRGCRMREGTLRVTEGQLGASDIGTTNPSS